MLLRLQTLTSILILPVVVFMFLLPADLLAEDHLVSAADLRQELRTAAQARQANLAKLDRFFSSEPARKALASASMDPAKVRNAIAFLSDQELARLASQADQVRSNFAGGGISLTNQQVTYIIIGLIAIAIIAIVASR